MPMYVTDKQFAAILLDSGIEENSLVNAVITANKLLKRYWQSIYSKAYSELVENISPETAAVLYAAKEVDKNSSDKLRHIAKLLKSMASNYQPTFTIQSPSEVTEKLETYLQNKVKDSHIDTEEIQTNMINIQGEWSYYKRSVDKDVRTLLWLYN